MAHLCNIKTNELCRCTIQLRPVKKETAEYYMLRDSIRDVGILQPLLVRPHNEVVCGNHRFECAKDLGLEEIPCIVRDLTDDEVNCIQVIENSNKIDTGPIDYIRRLQKIINTGQMDLEELAFCVHKHPDWIKKLLSLNQLSFKCKEALNNKEISMSIGVELAKLPVYQQDNLLDLHEQVSSKEFLEMIRQDTREVRGEQVVQTDSDVKPILRSFKNVYNEYLEPTDAATILIQEDAKTKLDGWKACLKWVLSIDKNTLIIRENRLKYKRRKEAEKSQLRDLEMKERKNEQRLDDTD